MVRRASTTRHDGRFAVRIKRLRLQQAFTQLEVAELAEIPVGTYRDWEYGRSVPNPGPRLRALCGVFRTTPLFLLYGEEEELHADH